MQPIIVTSEDRLQQLIIEAMMNPRVMAALKRQMAVDEPKGRYYTKAETAKLLKCSVRSIENRMKAGTYRYVKHGGRVRLLAEDVQKNLLSHMVDNRFKS